MSRVEFRGGPRADEVAELPALPELLAADGGRYRLHEGGVYAFEVGYPPVPDDVHVRPADAVSELRPAAPEPQQIRPARRRTRR